jgi:two-component system, LytTR family, response regulator
VVRRGNAHYFVDLDQVDRIDVADDYLRLHVAGRTHLCRGTMREVEEELDPARFVRVHRSALVGVDRIASARSQEGGGYLLELRDGTRVRGSRQYAERVRALLR